ncbi:MAG: hypothetical protein FJ267_00730 [Planctomycetes bacterium]|nr:hypothetical protein [Planctomycetota bacterium]
MIQEQLRDVGFRWTRPTWQRAGDRTWVLIIPSQFSRTEERAGTTDPRTDSSQRLYDVFEFDGSWVDQLHEGQIEAILTSPGWRRDLEKSLSVIASKGATFDSPTINSNESNPTTNPTTNLATKPKSR